jgi:hypothetical protein
MLVNQSADKRVAAQTAFLGAILALLLLSVPTSAEAKRFGTYVACNPARQKADPDRTCFQGDQFGAVFRAFRRDSVNYRVCMREPDGRKRCKNRETGARGRRSRVGFIPRSDRLGIYVFTWKIRGELVDRDRIRLASEGV